jgi:hypothetical protein
MTYSKISLHSGRVLFSRLVSHPLMLAVNEWLWRLILPLSLAVMVLFFFPARGDFEFSGDEGINLMKGMLVDRGYHLYSEVWSDQPPLMTYLLVLDFKMFGYKVGAARGLVLLFSCLLLWAAYEFTRQVWDKPTGLVAGILVILLPNYLMWSYSVLIGLPAIALAMVSLVLLGKWHRQKQYAWLILSAVALGLSVITKLFTGFLAGLFIAGILAVEYRQNRSSRRFFRTITPAAVWALVFALFVAFSFLLFVGADHLDQLFTDHQIARQVLRYSEQLDYTIGFHLKPAWPFIYLAIVGVVFTILSKRWLNFYLLGWMVSAYLMLFFHRPVWIHHQLLITVPAALLGSAAVMEALALVKKMVRTHFELNFSGVIRWIALVSCFILIFRFRVPDTIKLLSASPSTTNTGFDLGPVMEKFYYKMVEYAPDTNWVITDMPMYAFRARLMVPPSLVVFSDKRVQSGFLTEDQLLATIRDYQPEQVLLSKFEFPQVVAYLEEHYWIAHSKDAMKLYVRNDLRKK